MKSVKNVATEPTLRERYERAYEWYDRLLHKRKIEMADEILVVNIGGYIGESTRSEIKYALPVTKRS